MDNSIPGRLTPEKLAGIIIGLSVYFFNTANICFFVDFLPKIGVAPDRWGDQKITGKKAEYTP
ncbi:MAG: hypothetical protein HUN05_18025 [Desulfobacter sp.]|nr:MAG: hypothetical protein HUN05_18025 [Desulfobacter sp.]